MDGPDGQNPTLNNQPMSAKPGRIKRGEGGYNNLGSKVRGLLPLGTKANNLVDFKIDDHDGEVGI